jgi:hypothetical protein
VGTFHGSGGGESPARSARSLVLNRGDSSGGDPVDGVSVGGGEFLDGERGRAGLVSGHSLLFSLSHGGHEVVSDSVGGVRVVVLVDESVRLVEDVLAEVVLLDGSEGESVLRDVLHEGVLRGDSGVLVRDGTLFIALEDGGRERGGILEGVASGGDGRAHAPGALGVGITRSLVGEDIEARVSLGGGNGNKAGDSERAHIVLV